MARHTHTILSMMKDEGHSLIEWVAYHRHVGFDNICVYTNNCNDGTDDMLIRLEELGWVKHFRNDVPEGKKPQPNALALGSQNPEVLDSDWILVMDADEFVSVKCDDGRIGDVIARLPAETDALAITWRFFGSSEVTDWNPGLTIENYTCGAPDRFRKGWGVKSMFRPRAHIKFGIHRPTNKLGRIEQLGDEADILRHWVNGSGEVLPESFQTKGWRSTGRTLGYDLLEMNHYAVKSYEAYLLRRLRGNVNNKPDKYNAGYFAIFDRNEEDHPNVRRHADATKAGMAAILADPKMRQLQDDALAYHAARVEQLRAVGEYDDWLAELKKASAVPITGLDEVLFTQHLPKQWQEKIKEMQAEGVPDKVIAKLVATSVGIKEGEQENEKLDGAVAEAVAAAQSLPAARPNQRGDNRNRETALTTPLATAPGDTPRHRHTIMSMMKDEGHCLVEWVAYHRLIGFDNICVYTNNCSDGTDAMLMRLEQLGWCRHFRNDVPEGKRPQMNALSLAGDNAEVMDTEWLLVMDADEFLTVKTGDGTVAELTAAMEPEAQAMAITWRFHGSNDVTDWNPGLVTETYTRSADDGFRKGWGVKTLFKPYPDIKLGIHRPSIRKLKHRPERAKALLDQVWLNGSGARMPEEFSLSGWRSTRPTIGYDLAELKHFAVKSYEAYLLRRVRGNVNNKEDKYNAAYFAYFDRNEREDSALARHIPALKDSIAEILADPQMRDLQGTALAYHAARVEKLRASGEYDRWLEELKRASNVDVDRLKQEVVFTQHLPKPAQAEVKRLQDAGVPHAAIREFIDTLNTGAGKGQSREMLIAQTKGENGPSEEDHRAEVLAARDATRKAADALIAKHASGTAPQRDRPEVKVPPPPARKEPAPPSRLSARDHASPSRTQRKAQA